MDEALRFFRTYEIWIYLILGFGALVYFRRFWIAWRSLRSTIFGLERERAQNRLNQAAGALVLLIMIAIAEFVTVSFIVPMRPQANPLLTPTVDLFATPTTTLEPPLDGTPASASSDSNAEPTPTVDARLGTCVPGQVEISAPGPGDRISGEVTIEGSANIPNFGFYKLEVAPIQEVTWRTIQAGRQTVASGVLVQNWDTSALQAGDYVLRLVVTDNSGQALPDCQVPITITRPQN